MTILKLSLYVFQEKSKQAKNNVLCRWKQFLALKKIKIVLIIWSCSETWMYKLLALNNLCIPLLWVLSLSCWIIRKYWVNHLVRVSGVPINSYNWLYTLLCRSFPDQILNEKKRSLRCGRIWVIVERRLFLGRGFIRLK